MEVYLTNNTIERMTAAERLIHSTIRLEVQRADGVLATGSGFFFQFSIDENTHLPVIFTNKHVVRGAAKGRFSLNVLGPDGLPARGSHVKIEMDQFESRWVPHPSPDVDLCCMPIAPLIRGAETRGKKPFFISLDPSIIAENATLGELDALEDIIMIGYPNGIWDSTNNRPIVRKGITATPVVDDYEGRSEFVIDAACFPGSSGSPVFLYNHGMFTGRDRTVRAGTRVYLLGVLYAGPQYTAQGTVRVVPVPTTNQLVSLSAIPNNLGYVIKANRVLDFESILLALHQSMSV
jgi:hypothetical protein